MEATPAFSTLHELSRKCSDMDDELKQQIEEIEAMFAKSEVEELASQIKARFRSLMLRETDLFIKEEVEPVLRQKLHEARQEAKKFGNV